MKRACDQVWWYVYHGRVPLVASVARSRPQQCVLCGVEFHPPQMLHLVSLRNRKTVNIAFALMIEMSLPVCNSIRLNVN